MKKTVLLVMLFALFTANASYAAEFVLEEGTEILLSVVDNLRSGEARRGSVVRYRVEEQVLSREGYVLIQEGADAYGTVLASVGAGMLGRSGTLDISVERVKDVNGQDIRLRGVQYDEGASSTTGVIVGAVLLSPLALLFRGDNVVIEPGTIISAYVDNIATNRYNRLRRQKS